MHLRLLMLGLISLANFGLATFVLLKNRRSLINQLFAAFASSMASWVFCNQMAHWYAADNGIIWGRFTFVSATLIALTFFFFAHVFPNKSTLCLDKHKFVFLSLGVIFVTLSLSKFILVDLQPSKSNTIETSYGLAYPFFGIYFLYGFGYGLSTLAKNWKNSHGIIKLQIKYFFLGSFICFIGGATANLVIPMLFQTSHYSMFGPYFTILIVAFTSHIIIRYRLMDIKIVIRKSLVYILSSAIAVAILFVLVFPVRKTLAPNVDIPT